MLSIEHICKQFAGVQALQDISLTINTGERLGLIGPNGSGKTTLLNVITGLYKPTHGQIKLAEKNIAGLQPHTISQLGITRTFQNLRIFPQMTVLENIWVAQHSLKKISTRKQRDHILELLDGVDLLNRCEELAENLPLAEQRRLELARAIVRKPRILLLDEPAGGMTPGETESMIRLIKGLVPSPCTCIIIEHKMKLIESLCNRIAALNFGQLIALDKTAHVLVDPKVLTTYLGDATDA